MPPEINVTLSGRVGSRSVPFRSLLLAALVLTACTGGNADVDVHTGKGVTRVSTAPTAHVAPHDDVVGVDGLVGASFVAARTPGVSVATDAGVVWNIPLTAGSVAAPMAILAATGEPQTLGAVHFLSLRGAGALVVAADNGLFTENNGGLSPAPLNASLGGAKVRSLDSYGADGGEELWLNTDQGLLQVAAGQVVAVDASAVDQGAVNKGTVGGKDGSTIDAVVARSPGRAVLVRGGAAYDVDLTHGTSTAVASGFGALFGSAHGADGAVYLATAAGLVEYGADAKTRLFTFGGANLAAYALAPTPGGVLALTAAGVVQMNANALTRVTEAVDTLPLGITADSTGDVWTLKSGTLSRWHVGLPPSFAKDVKPFFEAHCMVCHATGTNNAPVLNFTDLATAQAQLTEIVRRLQNTASPMPPTAQERLSPTDYQVVIRWQQGGSLP